jgi:hypothetical protein
MIHPPNGAQHCSFSITLLLLLIQQFQQMAVVTIPENPCGKSKRTCSEFDVYHPDLGQGQLKDLHRIQSIAPREADGQKLKERATNMKLKDQREEGKEGTILLCSRFQHKPIHIHRQKVAISNPPNKQMLTNQMILKLISKTTAIIFQRHVLSMDMSSGKVTHNPHRRKNW